MDTGTSTSWSLSLGEIITTIQRFLEKISNVIQRILSSFLDVLDHYAHALSWEEREYLPPLRGTAMDGMTQDASSAVLPDYLYPDTTLRFSPSGNSKVLAASIPPMNFSAVRPESPWSLRVTSTTHAQRIAACKRSYMLSTGRINP